MVREGMQLCQSSACKPMAKGLCVYQEFHLHSHVWLLEEDSNTAG